jgi:hypothetical protein
MGVEFHVSRGKIVAISSLLIAGVPLGAVAFSSHTVKSEAVIHSSARMPIVQANADAGQATATTSITPSPVVTSNEEPVTPLKSSNTTVTVNGQSINMPPSGNMTKTIQSNNGTTTVNTSSNNVNVHMQSSGSGGSNSSIEIHTTN